MLWIIIIILLVCGGGGYWGNTQYGPGGGFGIGLGGVLVILLIWFLLSRSGHL